MFFSMPKIDGKSAALAALLFVNNALAQANTTMSTATSTHDSNSTTMTNTTDMTTTMNNMTTTESHSSGRIAQMNISSVFDFVSGITALAVIYLLVQHCRGRKAESNGENSSLLARPSPATHTAV